ncbi:M48 family metalloprotease [Solilutibacter pythonis]|nr:M48 family metalloprotease [Lysobacter pythonis]
MARHRALVARLEAELEATPSRYRMKLLLLALLGYAVLAGALVLALGMSVGLVIVLVAINPILLLKLLKLVWIPAVFGWLLLRALWVKFEPPTGYSLRRGEAPLLEAEIERLRVAAGAPKLDGILIDTDLNAAAVTLPRAMGLLGHRHYLLLGLPLLQLLDEAQLRSVIAHEFGHFGGRHGRFNGWIYRIRVSWMRLLAELDARGSWAGRLLGRFFGWYSPYFNAYSYALARRNEYEADAMAARLVGPQVAAQALVRVNIGSQRLAQDFWPAVERSLRDASEPPPALYRDMAASLRSTHPADGARLSWLAGHSAEPDDTHPTLVQRLAAMGVEMQLAEPAARSAAEQWLGPLLPALEARFSDDWRDAASEQWRAGHARMRADIERLDELELSEARSDAEVVEHARLVELLVPRVDPLMVYRHALARVPEDPFLHFRLGVLLLARGDADGVAHLHQAMRRDPACEGPALEALYGFHRQRGEDAELDAITRSLQRLSDRQHAARLQRGTISRRDDFMPHGLPEAVLDDLRATLAGANWVGRAWLVRKRIDDPGDVPHYVMLVRVRRLAMSGQGKLDRLVERIALPGTFLIMLPDGQRMVARKLCKVAGDPVYRH